jgi:integrase
MAATYKRTVGKRGNVTWSTVVDLGTDPATGKRRQKRISGHTRKDIERQAAEAIQRAESGFLDPKSLTVADFFATWLEATAPTLRPASFRRYQDVARLYIVKQLGGVKLSRLTAGDVQRFYARLLETLSPTTVYHLHGVLHHALDDAVKWGVVWRNVTDAVDVPRRTRPEMKTWSIAESTRFLETVAGDELEALFHLALTTGMRRGELLGLKWRDIDLDTCSLSVRRTLSRDAAGGYSEGEPKTTAGRRRVTLPVSTADVLRKHRTAQLAYRLSVGPVYTHHGYVFANETGDFIHPNTLTRRFQQLIRKADVPLIRFHDLRHTSATILLAQGVHPKIVQERLGHSDIAMTLNRYSHVTADMQQAAADAFENVFSRAG